MKHRYLTKSRFKLAIECPTKLFYTGKENVYQDNSLDDAFLQALAEGGFQVGELAKLLYPGGHEISTKDHQKALNETALFLAQDEVILYEPAFSFGNLFIRVDILVKKGNYYQLIEVKAKSINSKELDFLNTKGSINSRHLPYIQDIAFQRYVFSKAYPEARVESFLMMADKSTVSNVDGLNQMFKIRRSHDNTKVIVSPEARELAIQCKDLLFAAQVDQYIDMIFSNGISFPGGHGALPELAEEWATSYHRDIKIRPHPSAACSSCQFKAKTASNLKSGFHECFREAYSFSDGEIDQGTVLDLYNFRLKGQLLNLGKVLLNTKTLSQDEIGLKSGDKGLTDSERQWMQISAEISEHYDHGGFYLNTLMIKKEMDCWKYPWHMIDFETSTAALPFFKGTRPYESTAFQFSHHIIHEDGKVEHAGQFLLADPKVSPNIEFIRALKSELDKDQGTIFRWSNHENTILNHIQRQLDESKNPPEDRDELISFIKNTLKSGNRAMVDLCELAKRAYYHPDTKGSSSIKAVFPAVLKSSNYLKMKYSKPIYGSLDGIKSLNFHNLAWLQCHEDQFAGPYEYLIELGKAISGGMIDLEISNGGAASMAYSRLQFEDLSDMERLSLKNGLLRYCEVDTLAMVMISEAWREWARNSPLSINASN